MKTTYRENWIYRMRFVEGMTYQEIGDLFDMSRQRVHQIIKRLLPKYEILDAFIDCWRAMPDWTFEERYEAIEMIGKKWGLTYKFTNHYIEEAKKDWRIKEMAHPKLPCYDYTQAKT